MYCIKQDNPICVLFCVFEFIRIKENMVMLNCKYNIHVYKAQRTIIFHTLKYFAVI